MKLLTLLGIIPQRLATVRPPKCTGCIFVAMKKRPWRINTKNNGGRIKAVTTTNSCISVDKIKYPSAEFIAQLKVSLKNQSCKAVTIFVDQSNRLIYVHLQRGLTSDDTFQDKNAFEAHRKLPCQQQTLHGK